eukprot:CAMPEP_0116889132 /NCGR_PEP_ID=MMETSP0463-20121206/24501_1 /TAXON_ID=181622 /ORGANISM="Strombidinopsis sp, Strain SopsisLIS2011" /LENGTH=56 /DNA_ID=CAMNT_0004555285 /DNA_START=300 /DNA_END=470 /DNA_ORIENTATION=+
MIEFVEKCQEKGIEKVRDCIPGEKIFPYKEMFLRVIQSYRPDEGYITEHELVNPTI